MSKADRAWSSWPRNPAEDQASEAAQGRAPGKAPPDGCGAGLKLLLWRAAAGAETVTGAGLVTLMADRIDREAEAQPTRGHGT